MWHMRFPLGKLGSDGQMEISLGSLTVREPWIDSWKGLLILLVVLGHVAGGAYHMATGSGVSLAQSVYRVIYMFHMPAFFVLSGVVWNRHNEGIMTFAAKKAYRLLIPYLIFGIGGLLLFLALNSIGVSMDSGVSTTTYYTGTKGNSVWIQVIGLVHASGWPNEQGLRMNSVLWFLPCMFTVLMFYRFLYLDSDRYRWIILTVSFLFSFISVPAWLPWGISKLPYYLFFVILGRNLKPGLLNLLGRTSWWIWMGMFVVYVGVVSMLPPLETVRGFFLWRLSFRVLTIIGIFLSATLVKVFNLRCLSLLGSMSMGIMLVHKYFVTALQWKILPLIKIPYDTWWGCLLQVFFVTVASVFASCLVVCFINSKFPFLLGIAKKR